MNLNLNYTNVPILFCFLKKILIYQKLFIFFKYESLDSELPELICHFIQLSCTNTEMCYLNCTSLSYMNLSQGLNVQLNAFTLPESSSYLAHLRSKWAVCAPQRKTSLTSLV